MGFTMVTLKGVGFLHPLPTFSVLVPLKRAKVVFFMLFHNVFNKGLFEDALDSTLVTLKRWAVNIPSSFASSCELGWG